MAILADLLKEEEMASSLPEAARAMFRLMLDLLAGLAGKIAALDKEIARRARMTTWQEYFEHFIRPRLQNLAASQPAVGS